MKRNMLAFAISIVAHAFEDKLYNGRPYFLHVMRVASWFDSDDEMQQAAIMHDLVEDTTGTSKAWTPEMLRNEGFSERVIRMVVSLTHLPSENYDDYIKRVSLDRDATEIKKRDLEDNSQITRLKGGLTKHSFDRLERYYRAYTYLSKI